LGLIIQRHFTLQRGGRFGSECPADLARNQWPVWCGISITASVFINDNESGLHQDYETWLEKLAPHEPISKYLHNRTGEDNGDAHLKRQIMGRAL